MEVSHIKYFLALCQAGRFTRAAAACGISQPSFSTAIRRLEHELGHPLFDRGPPVRLSPLGEAIKPHFEAILREIDKVHQLSPVAEGMTRSADDQEHHEMAPLRLP
jgi:LysR family cyn operon transcriptional activator